VPALTSAMSPSNAFCLLYYDSPFKVKLCTSHSLYLDLRGRLGTTFAAFSLIHSGLKVDKLAS